MASDLCLWERRKWGRLEEEGDSPSPSFLLWHILFVSLRWKSPASGSSYTTFAGGARESIPVKYREKSPKDKKSPLHLGDEFDSPGPGG